MTAGLWWGKPAEFRVALIWARLLERKDSAPKQRQSCGFHEISFLSFFLLASAPALVAKADVPTLVSPADSRVQ